jgi:hypothetical protein
MAQPKPVVLFDPEKHLYQVQTKDAQGNTRIADSMSSIEAMETTAAVQVFLGLAKDAPNKRVAAVSLLAAIMGQFSDSIEAWRGNGDPKQPVPNELKGTFQRLEVRFFEQFQAKDHPYREQFMNRLPPADMRGKSLDAGAKPNWEARFDAFLTATRKDSTYANAKNTVLGFFSYLGRSPVGDDGQLIPPEAMAVMVRNARIVEEADNSYKGKLAKLYRILVADSDEGDAPADDDMPTIVAMLGEMLDKAKTLESAAATRARQRMTPGQTVAQVGVAEAAKEAIASAQAQAEAKPGAKPFIVEPLTTES